MRDDEGGKANLLRRLALGCLLSPLAELHVQRRLTPGAGRAFDHAGRGSGQGDSGNPGVWSGSGRESGHPAGPVATGPGARAQRSAPAVGRRCCRAHGGAHPSGASASRQAAPRRLAARAGTSRPRHHLVAWGPLGGPCVPRLCLVRERQVLLRCGPCQSVPIRWADIGAGKDRRGMSVMRTPGRGMEDQGGRLLAGKT